MKSEDCDKIVNILGDTFVRSLTIKFITSYSFNQIRGMNSVGGGGGEIAVLSVYKNSNFQWILLPCICQLLVLKCVLVYSIIK